MVPSTNVLADARQLIERRLADLEEERKRLERAIAELNGKGMRRRPGRPRGSASKSSSGTPRRKRRGSTRSDQAVKLIEAQPGMSASRIASSMKIKPNYVYRVLGDLEKDGRVKKDRRQYFPVGG